MRGGWGCRGVVEGLKVVHGEGGALLDFDVQGLAQGKHDGIMYAS